MTSLHDGNDAVPGTHPGPSLDLLIAGGTVVDGSGGPPRRADVGIAGDRIVAVGDLPRSAASRVLDVPGLVVAPGFVDAHGHSDVAVLSSPRVPSKIRQGITTEVMGNCGLGVAPFGVSVDPGELRALLSIVDVDPGVEWRWRTVAEYLGVVEAHGSAFNVAMLAGNLPIRASCCGYGDRPATATEVAGMQEMTDQALSDGAVGLSCGLMYPPNAYAGTDELVALGEVVARHGAMFAFHLRDYGDQLLESVDEALAVAERSGCRVQISHLTVLGERNWGKVSAALKRIDAVAARGADVAVDCYPYLAGSTNMTQMLPRWTLDGGNDALLERLGNPGERRRIGAELEAGRLQDWNGVLVVGGSLGATADDLMGRSVADIAAARGVPPAEAFLQVVEQSAGSAVMVAFGRSEEDLRAVLAHPRSMIGSDGLGLDPDGPSGGGMPHPRSYGCYPRLLGRYVRDLGALSLEAAVHKATFQVAERFGIPDRGLIAPGWIADLVVFDPARITDPATFTDPQQMAVGVEAVTVSGRLAVERGTQSGELAGVVLRRRTGGQAI